MNVKSLTEATDDGGLKGTSLLWRISVCLILLGSALYIIGFSTDRWCHVDEEKQSRDNKSLLHIDVHFGLWRKCEHVKVDHEHIRDGCKDMDNDEAWKPTSKAMCCVGLIFIIVGGVGAVSGGAFHSTRFMGFGGVFVIVGAVTAAVGCVIFEGNAKDTDDKIDPGYSVFFALIGCLILILGGGSELLSIRTGYTAIA